MKKINSKLLFLACFTLISLLSAGDWITVKRVIDGDTFESTEGITYRLIGFDTPETKDPRKPIQYFGQEAYVYTQSFLEGNNVRVEYDWQKTDKYGRTLAYVFLEDSTFFNAKIIKDGYAYAYTQYPFKQEYMDEFVKLEKEARENKRGLWADDSTSVSSGTKPTSPIPDTNTIVKHKSFWFNSGSATLHNSSCRWYGNTKQGYFTDDTLGKDCGICRGANRIKVTAPLTSPAESGGETYWINTNSMVRHNSRCRWYGNTKSGYYTKEKVGRACGICGG